MTLYEMENVDGVYTFKPVKPAVKAEGIDVSLYQGSIDWVKVRTQKSFAFIKATQGSTITDPQFTTNWTNAKSAGVKRSAYHYYKFNADPILQAGLFCSKLSSDNGELNPVVDVEDTASPANITQLKQFIDAVTTSLGMKPIIYTAAWFWNNARWGGSVAWAKDYPLWVANYGVKEPTLPTDWTQWTYWQYSNKGRVAGINGDVDLDQFNGVELDTPFWVSWPVDGSESPRITDKFNAPRDYANGKHEGIDMDAYINATGENSPILSAQNGVVEYVSIRTDSPSYGSHIVIRHPWNGIDDRYRTLYGHMSSIMVSEGDTVTRGQQIGVSGATGTSAIHLHFGVYDSQSGLSGYVRCKDCSGLFPEGVIDPESVLKYG